MNRRLLLALLFASVLVGACGSSAAEAEGQPLAGACAELGDFPGRCEEAVAIANARLGWLHWPISSTELRGSLCGPNMRCAHILLPGVRSWVIYQFMFGDPVMIHVHLQEQDGELVLGPDGEDVLVADAPEPLPDWLLDEMAAAKG